MALNTSTILQAIQFSPSVKSAHNPAEALSFLKKIAEGNLILIGAGLLPGYVLTFLLIDRLGRKTIQYTGFAALFVIFMIMGKTLFYFHSYTGTVAKIFLVNAS